MGAATVAGRDAHLDVPLSNIVVRAFESAGNYVAQRLFPAVPVNKQNDKYYVIDQDSWMRIPETRRAPMTSPNRVEFKVSSDSYFADNRALASAIAKEHIANADAALRVRTNRSLLVTQMLLRDLEDRVARTVTSISNVGSGVTLTGADKWTDYTNSDPIADVTTGASFIYQKTGLLPNTMVIDPETIMILQRHPLLLDVFKGVEGGFLTLSQLTQLFGITGINQIMVATGQKNNALENATASLTSIWGNNCLLAYVDPATVGLETVTFGLSMRWTPEGIPAPMQVMTYDDPDPGRKAEIVEAGYYQDEKIVARNLAYLIAAPR